MERRSFLELFAAGAIGFSALHSAEFSNLDQIDWSMISKQYPDSGSRVLNLNNGSAGMMSKVVEDQLVQFIREMNINPPYEKAIYWDSLNQSSKSILGDIIDARPEELALVRNTTEALSFVFHGYEIPEKSNVVCAHHDYTYAINALKKMSVEKNYKLNIVDIQMPADNGEIIEAYRKVIKDDTSMVLITAMTHREGQIMPVKEIAKLAKAKGAKVLVDAAHAIGHYEHSVTDWNCDFYCTSLHKWLGGPLGTGLLYIKKPMLEQVKGSYGLEEKYDSTMVKFEAVGTKSFALNAALLSSLRYHQNIGTKNKHQRLQQLTDYWVEGVREIPKLKTIVPPNYGAVANFHLSETSKGTLSFFKSKDIHFKKVCATNSKRTTFRISPNIYHTFKDLDRFIEAIHVYSKRL